MKVAVYSTKDGKEIEKIELAEFFSEKINPYLIARAVISDQTKKFQPKGNYIYAGLETSAKYRGRKEDFGSLKNRGGAKLPREVMPKGTHGKVRRIPSSVKGRRAHPPKVEKKIVEKINKKEYIKALQSALAACANIEYVLKRGHKIDQKMQLPIILDVESSPNKTSQLIKLLTQLGLEKDLNRSKKPKKISGIQRRTKSKKYPKTFLLIVKDKNSPLARAARNIAGATLRSASEVEVQDLAPGTQPGRLLIITKDGLTEIEKRILQTTKDVENENKKEIKK